MGAGTTDTTPKAPVGVFVKLTYNSTTYYGIISLGTLLDNINTNVDINKILPVKFEKLSFNAINREFIKINNEGKRSTGDFKKSEPTFLYVIGLTNDTNPPRQNQTMQSTQSSGPSTHTKKTANSSGSSNYPITGTNYGGFGVSSGAFSSVGMGV